jgi:hypothetical protein
MADTSKCNDSIGQFTLLWLVDDRSTAADVFCYRLKSKCLYVLLEILYFYHLDTTVKCGKSSNIFGNNANESEFCSGRN